IEGDSASASLPDSHLTGSFWKKAGPVMSLSLLLGGTIAPMLFLLSPASVAMVRDCLEWDPPAKMAAVQAKRPCPNTPMLM
ncbi:MAG TPA: hypothetical protein VJ762_07305, partial [Sphingobium sp.]|nr:hypothetical protein [Sphingobium sp.]